MKPATPPNSGLLSHLRSLAAMSFGIAAMGVLGQAKAEAVDSELVLLVDVTRSGLNNRDFGTLMESYAASFTSLEVLNSIQSGTHGRIAVSLMFYSSSSNQQIGIPWMSIGGATEAAEFARLATIVIRPGSGGSVAPGPALTAAAASFGTETGGGSNGFESAVQVINVAASATPSPPSQTGVATARDGALASGVDLINTIAIGDRTSALESFYAANVIGSTLPANPATISGSPVNGLLATNLAGGISQTVQIGTAAVPEPSPVFGLLATVILVLGRRRRA